MRLKARLWGDGEEQRSGEQKLLFLRLVQFFTLHRFVCRQKEESAELMPERLAPFTSSRFASAP